jgi:signal transduction histidine kinase
VDHEPAAAGTERWQALLEAGIAVASGLELDEVLQRLVAAARALTGARYSALGVLDETGTALSRFITSGIDDAQRRLIGDLPRGRGILGVLIHDATPLRLIDLGDDPRAVGFPPGHPPMHSFLGVPVTAGGAVFGNLYLTEREDGEFTAEDESIATLLAANAGVAIHNARLYAQANEHAEALRRALTDLSSVSTINEAILSGHPHEQVLGLIADRARESLDVRLVAIALPDPDRTRSTFVAAAGDGSVRVLGSSVGSDSTTGTVLLARRSLTIDDAHAGDELGARTAAFVPLIHRSDALGVIAAADPADGRQFDDNDLGVLGLFAARAVLALEVSRGLEGERRRVEAESRLAEAEHRSQARRETLIRIVEAQEEERGRIARELHDEFGQHLASVLLGLRLVEQAGIADEARGAMAELVQTINAAISQLRTLAIELRPTALDDFGLVAALERLIETYSRRTGIPVELAFEEMDSRLPSLIETTVYRVVQESLTNVAKHAGAGSVTVRGEVRGPEFVIAVTDDGAGFDAGDRPEGFGLNSMRERAEMVSGVLNVTTRASGGTTVELRVPR